MSSAATAIKIARAWIGTPFLEGGSVCGVGADCVGLLEGIGRDLGFAYPTRQEVEADLVRAALSCLVQVDQPQAGAILLLSAHIGGPPLHAALLTDADTIIHAHWRAGVVENRFGNWFQARLTHRFMWPQSALGKDI
jgi:cell wall-associated NlpC family hydrolase